MNPEADKTFEDPVALCFLILAVSMDQVSNREVACETAPFCNRIESVQAASQGRDSAKPPLSALHSKRSTCAVTKPHLPDSQAPAQKSSTANG